MAKPIDYDALLKDFINDFFPDFIAFVNPVLFEAIDWSQGYEFLEQELISSSIWFDPSNASTLTKSSNCLSL